MTKLFVELKRRKVFRVAAVYAVVAWLLIQVADVLAPMLSLPDSAPRLVLFLLIILFPIALFLAWAYELTPDGMHADSGTTPSGASDSPVTTFAFIGVVVAIAVFLYTSNREPAEVALEPVEDVATVELDKSIAVLPFSAFSSDPEEQFFADGLADTLLNKLAQLSDMKVISRSSSFQYRGDAVDVRRVGQELEVATVLEGSVQRSGDRLRIIAQLVNTRDGGHIWSESFDRNSEDIFAIQDQISEAVVQSLQVSMSSEESQRIADSGTESVEAYNRLLRIKEMVNRNEIFDISMEDYRREMFGLIEEIDQVLELDPNYAEAYRTIARTYDLLIFQSSDRLDYEYFIRLGFEALHQAMLLEPDNPNNYSAYAALHRRQGDMLTAEVFARMALNRLPNHQGAMANLSLSLINQNKNLEEALELTYREEAVDPTQETTYRRRTFALRRLGRTDEAIELLREQIGKEGISQQLVADDLYRTQVEFLGNYQEAIRSLIQVRNTLEDDVGDVLLRGWASMAVNLGLRDELEKVNLRWESETERNFTSVMLMAINGRLDEAKQIANELVAASNLTGPRFGVAEICILQQDYECAVASYESSSSNLVASAGLSPSIINNGHFQFGIKLAHAYRKTGANESANRLVQALNDWYQERAETGNVWAGRYVLAEFFLQLGDTNAALAEIRKGVLREGDNFIPQCAFCSFESSLYEALHDNSEFQELVVEYDRRKAVNAEAVKALIAEAGY